MVTGHSRGRPTVFVKNEWLWADTLELITNKRPCVRCGRIPTAEGYDACLGYIPKVVAACCGHGIFDGHITFENGKRLTAETYKNSKQQTGVTEIV